MPGLKCCCVMAAGMLIGSAAFAAPGRGAQPRPPARLFFSVQWPDHSQIYSMRPDGSDRVCLTPTSDTDHHPAVSPDGKTVAFTTLRDGVRAIYLMNPDGTNQRRLTHEGDAGLCAWSPDGKRLAFSSNRSGRYCIYVMNADGTDVHRLTEGPSEDCPVWSADGRRIAYEGRQNNIWRVYVLNANGTGLHQITTEKWDNRWPQWSPDGRRIAYTSYEQGKGDIYTMRPDGTRATDQTDNPAEDRQPAWAGGRLLFHSDRAGRFDIFSVGLNSRDASRLTADPKDTAEVSVASPGLARRSDQTRGKRAAQQSAGAA